MLVSTQPDIHDLLKNRWSPRAYADRPIEEAKLVSLFEAARWAPSAGNKQPWAFIVVKQDDPVHDSLVEAMAGHNTAWAGHAPVIVAAIANLEYKPGMANPYALYDLGQSVAHLTVQAAALGLHVHQIAGFDKAKAQELLNVPEGYEVVTLATIGYVGMPEQLPDELRQREVAPRQRKALNEFVYAERWDVPLFEA
jgi:nitroreductase